RFDQRDREPGHVRDAARDSGHAAGDRDVDPRPAHARRPGECAQRRGGSHRYATAAATAVTDTWPEIPPSLRPAVHTILAKGGKLKWRSWSMPIHDWTRVDAGIFHAFHHEWITEIGRALNRGLLPPDYYALPEQQA